MGRRKRLRAGDINKWVSDRTDRIKLAVSDNPVQESEATTLFATLAQPAKRAMTIKLYFSEDEQWVGGELDSHELKIEVGETISNTVRFVATRATPTPVYASCNQGSTHTVIKIEPAP